MRCRRGVALLAVLGIIVAGSGLSLAISFAARESAATVANRIAARSAYWSAEECLALTLSELDRLMSGVRIDGMRRPIPLWDSLPALVANASTVSACAGEVRLRPAGLTLDINSATTESIRRALRFAGVPALRADSMAAAAADWRDADGRERLNGCERECYAQADMSGPRDSAFVSLAELRMVRGFTSWSDDHWASGASPMIFDVEPARVLIDAAPPAVLAALPGIGDDGARAIVQRRGPSGLRIASLAELEELLPPSAREQFRAALPELAAVATVTPDAWLLDIRSPRPGRSGERTSPGAAIRVRLAFGVPGVRVTRRRILP